MSHLVAYGTGWLAAPSLALLRRLHRPAARALERRLRPHYRLGGTAAALGVLHGLVSITRAPLPAGAEAGLWLACGAAVALVFAAALGAGLRALGGIERERARRRHLALFVAAVVLGGLHVLLNGPLPT